MQATHVTCCQVSIKWSGLQALHRDLKTFGAIHYSSSCGLCGTPATAGDNVCLTLLQLYVPCAKDCTVASSGSQRSVSVNGNKVAVCCVAYNTFETAVVIH